MDEAGAAGERGLWHGGCIDILLGHFRGDLVGGDDAINRVNEATCVRKRRAAERNRGEKGEASGGHLGEHGAGIAGFRVINNLDFGAG